MIGSPRENNEYPKSINLMFLCSLSNKIFSGLISLWLIPFEWRNDTVLTTNYNNLVAMKDIQQQISNSIAAIGNLVSTENAATRQLIQDNYIRELSDKLQTTRDALSNANQTATLTAAIQNSTDSILNSQGRYVLNPPCYTGCGCGSLY